MGCQSKTKVIPTAIQRKKNNLENQFKLRVKTNKLPQVQENAGDQVVIESVWHLIG